MIYTVGNEQVYLSAIQQGRFVKNARSEKFPTAKVWETLEAAQAVLEPEMAVFGVEADWEADTAPDADPAVTFRHLVKDGDVVKVPGQPYFVNRTPFLVGMPADHALTIIKRTFRKTKRAPEEVKEDENGLVVKWFLSDCTLVLRRMKKIGPYVITGIKSKEPHPQSLSVPKPTERGAEA